MGCGWPPATASPPWSFDPKLDAEIHALYEDSRKAIWTEFVDAFVATVPMVEPLRTRSADRKTMCFIL